MRFCPSLAALVIMTSPAFAAEPTAADRELARLFKAYLDEEFARHPYFATLQGEHSYDHQLDDLVQAKKTDRKQAEAWLAKLKKFNTTGLSRDGLIDYRIWRGHLESTLALLDAGLDRFDYDPRVFGEYISDSVFVILTQSTLPKPRNISNAAGRIGEIPKVVAAAKEKIMLTKCPRILTEVAIKRNKGAIAFYEKEIFELTGETPATSPLAKPCQQAVKALQDYQMFLEEELLPRSTGDWRIGKELFEKKLQIELDAGLTAAEVIQLAEAEADRVERDMYFVAKQLWSRLFPGFALPPDDAAGRRATVQRVLDQLGEDHSRREDFVADARKTVDKLREFIKTKKILTLPDPDRCKIIEMPEFQRGFSAAYLNPAPPLDSKADSLYAVAPPPQDWPAERQTAFFKEYNRSMLQILTIHEAYPGHYVQLEYGNRHPSLIRKVLYSGVFAEGWAVYTEQMMLDQGYGDGDLGLRLHQLKFYIRAVLNAILDHHMHCRGMTDDQAMKMLMERGFQTEGEAFGKVQRAKQSSCQLSTYFVGRTAFYNLRQRAQRQRGEKFVLGTFHEEVLSHGTISVKFLPELLGLTDKPPAK